MTYPAGRGSLKSSAVSLIVPPLLIHNPGTHALVLRKVANTIRDSVYAQYLWAIGELGMAAYWDAKVQPMELIYRPTGQKIMFRGADDPMKIKSIKVPFGYIAVTHFEEKDQFAGRAEIRTILQSTMRGGSKFWNFESYNRPSAGTTGPTRTVWRKEQTGCVTRVHTWKPLRSGWGHSSWRKPSI